MPRGYLLVVTVHVVASLVWLGGMLFFAIVAPVLRGIDDAALRSSLFDSLGRRFRTVGWWCIVILLGTGVAQLSYRGWLSADVLGSADFWSAPLGMALAWKLWLVALMLGIQAVHDFGLGPAAGRATPGTEEAATLRKWAAWLARANAVAGLLLVYVAVRLARGG